MRRHSGFVLLIVLVFMQLIAVLGLCALRAARIEYKINADDWQFKQYELTVKSILSLIEHSFYPGQADCLLSFTDHLGAKPLAWWKTMTCTGNFSGNQYYYFHEFLGNDQCAIIKFQDKEVVAAYYRFTLLFLPKSNFDVKYLLQSTIAVPDVTDVSKCLGNVHLVIAGQQGLRRL